MSGGVKGRRQVVGARLDGLGHGHDEPSAAIQ